MRWAAAGVRRLPVWTVCAALLVWCAGASAQKPGCSAAGYRVLAVEWDAVMRTGWELRQDCTHPEWPARLGPVSAATAIGPKGGARPGEGVVTATPLLVHAGDAVKVWMQDERVRIEMQGVVEQSARLGDRVRVRVTHLDGDAGMTVEEIGGLVRGVGDVEMEP